MNSGGPKKKKTIPNITCPAMRKYLGPCNIYIGYKRIERELSKI